MPSMSTIESLFCRSTPWEAATRRWVLPWALQGVRPTGRVLEIGGGGGAMAAQLLAASAPADQVQLTVTDFDPVMVAAAQDRLQRFGDRAQARVADAAALPFGDDEFDTVVSFIMLHHVVDWEQALREAVRVLRPAEPWSATTCSAPRRRGSCTGSKAHRTGSSTAASCARTWQACRCGRSPSGRTRH